MMASKRSIKMLQTLANSIAAVGAAYQAQPTMTHLERKLIFELGWSMLRHNGAGGFGDWLMGIAKDIPTCCIEHFLACDGIYACGALEYPEGKEYEYHPCPAHRHPNMEPVYVIYPTRDPKWNS